MSNASLIDVLLHADKNKLKKQETETVEIKRLSKLLNTDFILEVRALTNQEIKDIETDTIKIGKKGQIDADLNAYMEKVFIRGVVSPNLKDPSLLKYYGCASVSELLETLFYLSEINEVANIITEIGKIGEENNVERVKKQ